MKAREVSAIEQIYCFVQGLQIPEDYRKIAFKELVRPVIELSEEIFLREVENDGY